MRKHIDEFKIPFGKRIMPDISFIDIPENYPILSEGEYQPEIIQHDGQVYIFFPVVDEDDIIKVNKDISDSCYCVIDIEVTNRNMAFEKLCFMEIGDTSSNDFANFAVRFYAEENETQFRRGKKIIRKDYNSDSDPSNVTYNVSYQDIPDLYKTICNENYQISINVLTKDRLVADSKVIIVMPDIRERTSISGQKLRFEDQLIFEIEINEDLNYNFEKICFLETSINPNEVTGVEKYTARIMNNGNKIVEKTIDADIDGEPKEILFVKVLP